MHSSKSHMATLLKTLYAILWLLVILTVAVITGIYFTYLVSDSRSDTREEEERFKLSYHHGTGFVMALHFSDQMTSACINLESLQCWVASVTPNFPNHSVFVVEPFIHQGSNLGASFVPDADDSHSGKTSQSIGSRDTQEIGENMIRLRDVYDIEKWSEKTKRRGYASLKSWDYFLNHAPRKMILVQKECGNRRNCMECKSHQEAQNFYQSAQIFAKEHNFTIVLTVCLSMHTISLKDFNRKVYGGFSPVDVVLVFNHWGGIVPKSGMQYRIPITHMRECIRFNFDGLMEHSKNVISDSKQYLQRYMPKTSDSSSKGGYIGVMLRLEWYAVNSHLPGKPKDKQKQVMMKCINTVVDKVNTLKQMLGIEAVFLAMDYGKYGTLNFKPDNSYGYRILYKRVDPSVLDEVAHKLYEMIFGNSSTLEEWENSFDTVAKFRAPGYVAMLQKVLAANATGLVLAGGGGFQNTAELLYRNSHSILKGRIVEHACN